MNIRFKNEISTNFMMIEDVKEFSGDDYPVRILVNNDIKDLLKMDYEVINGRVNLLYNISSRESFAKTYSNRKIGFTELKVLIYSLNSLIKSLKEYLLDADNVMLKQECIFVDQASGAIEYCYFPYYHGNFVLELRELFAQLLSMVDYTDQKAVRLVYDIQKETQNDNFTFEDIIKTTGKISTERPGFNEQYDNDEDGQKEEKEPERQFFRTGRIPYADMTDREKKNKKEKRKKEFFDTSDLIKKAGNIFKDKKNKKEKKKEEDPDAGEDIPYEILNLKESMMEESNYSYKRYTNDEKSML